MKFLIPILLIISMQLNGQSWYKKFSVEWLSEVSENERNEDALKFRFANYSSVDSEAGYYFNRISWNRSYKNVSVDFLEVSTEIMGPASYYPEISNSVFSIEHSYGKESGNGWLMFSVFPFRVNQESGMAERITSFVLEIKAEEGISEVQSLSKKSVSETESSPLSTGNWYKIRTSESGIYKLTYSALSGLGIENPGNTRVYGWGGTQLPEDVSDGTQDELLPVQTYVSKGDDGIFGAGDYMLFYATGPVSWEYDEESDLFEHNLSNYSDYGYYFLNAENGTALETEDAELAENPTYLTSEYDFYDYHEEDLFNALNSGKEWLGELFDLTTVYSFNFTIPDINTSKDLILSTRLLSRANSEAEFLIYGNNILIGNPSINSTSLSSSTAYYARSSNEDYLVDMTSENLVVKLEYVKPDATASGMLDYLTVNARAEISLNDDQLVFRDKESVGDEVVAKFSISGTDADTKVWMINDIHDVKNIPITYSSGISSFIIESPELYEFIAFKPDGSFPAPDYSGDDLGLIENQDLHDIGHPDMIIITHTDFQEEAERLAEYREENNDLDVFITYPEKIYNDFSSGRPDVTALRNFIRSVYLSADGDENLQPKFLLMFGDGSYEFKNAGADEGNYVPTYQSDNSLNPIYSYVSDDFFGLLDDGESMLSGLLDIGIGRFPVNSLSEATTTVDKIIGYESTDKMGDWRNTICFIGDDEDSNLHLQQADELATIVEEKYSSFNINKIYLDAYEQETTSSGDRYPDVNLAINEQVNKGALIINYTGHGGTNGLAHEQVLKVDDINSWENSGKLPLFMTATCEFSLYDDPDEVSAGEEVFLNPDGGGIALLTTTRLVYAGPNYVLNEKFYDLVFEKTEEGLNYCLGDIVKYSKNNAGSGINKRNFTLLGDPSMRLSYPSQKIVTDSLNGIPVEVFQDSIGAFDKLTVWGHIEDDEGQLISDFNGFAYPSIYDKSITQTTLGNDEKSYETTFEIRKNVIYKGTASVVDGRFSFSFIVPKDINYNFGSGKISYYATDSLRDAAGSDTRLVIGGSSEDLNEDTTGPELNVYMNNNYFLSGGITDENPVLYVEILDESGINTTGNGIGHDIMAVLNNDTQNSYEINDYYQADLDSYQSGTIEYPFFNLDEGHYEVEVKVWDIYNNSSTGSTEFVVILNEELVLDELLNFPNPFRDYTEFSFEHNKSDTDLDIVIDIYNINGELVKTIMTTQYSTGYRSDPISWDGTSDHSNRNRQGVYIYKIRVTTEDGSEAEKSGRMIILR